MRTAEQQTVVEQTTERTTIFGLFFPAFPAEVLNQSFLLPSIVICRFLFWRGKPLPESRKYGTTGTYVSSLVNKRPLFYNHVTVYQISGAQKTATFAENYEKKNYCYMRLLQRFHPFGSVACFLLTRRLGKLHNP
jgi:hypothetical protein